MSDSTTQITMTEPPVLHGRENEMFELPSYAEVHVSAEISERAPTKDRPDVTYGTTTKLSITYSVGDDRFTGEALQVFIATQHAIMEEGLQSEIRRRKVYRDVKPESDVPF